MTLSEKKMHELEEKARQIRILSLKMLNKAGSGHPGGALSMADILAYLYYNHAIVKPEDPKNPGRDRIILSKGHGCPSLYAVLALKGFFPVEELNTLRKIDSKLQGHPDMNKTPGVEMSTGSLGQGLSAANGMALAGKLDKEEYRVFCILGDGELQEGQVWEAAMSSSHYHLDNLVGILDYNGLQIDGYINDVMNPEPLREKWESFGWNTVVIDGHDFRDMDKAFREADASKDRPFMIIARTVKGKGVSFMEDMADWHGKAPDDDQLAQALEELEKGGNPNGR